MEFGKKEIEMIIRAIKTYIKCLKNVESCIEYNPELYTDTDTELTEVRNEIYDAETLLINLKGR